VALTNREKTVIIVYHLVSLYSEELEKGMITDGQSVIDFIMKNIPQEYKPDLSIEVIDDVFNFIASKPMELS